MSLFVDLSPAAYCPHCEVIAVPGTCCSASEPATPPSPPAEPAPEPADPPSDEDLEFAMELLEWTTPSRHSGRHLEVAAAALRELLRTREWIRRLETHAARHGCEPCGNCGTRLWEWRTPLRCSECGEVRP